VLEAGPDTRPFEVQLGEVAERIVAFFKEISPRLSVLRASGIPPDRILAAYETPPPVVALRALTAWLKRCHQGGLIRDVKFESVAMAILGSLHFPSFLTHLLDRPPSRTSFRAHAEQTVELISRGLQKS
jgi:hypothetical protein